MMGLKSYLQILNKNIELELVATHGWFLAGSADPAALPLDILGSGGSAWSGRHIECRP